jgi:DNA-binding transcriptional ArsR family regulator
MPSGKRELLTDERFRLISRALADPRRHEILQQIGEAKKALPCCQMRGGLCISAPTLSHHMKELETAGLVEAARAGKFVSYTLRRDVLQAYIDRLAKI